ncbi:hypothetical protein [Pseudoxanthomonas putridarboris]|uniref:Uncharacterized protein n=1 Tax=Pseudoxanthomonas putridarboris TaxID=752605 RepID=A0ABU9J0R8_9GAMM
MLVSGYHRQAVAGLPADVPVLVSTHDDRGACGYFYVAEKRLAQLNPIATRLFDRPVDMVYLAREGSVTIGDAVSAESLVTSPRIAPDSFRDLSAPLAGEAGLRDAVAKGLLREARRSDMDAWQQARAAVDRSAGTLPPIAGQSGRAVASHDSSLHNGYVVLKPMILPAGLYGAHSATFIVPKGVPRPTGNPGHSAIYDFNTLTCAGAVCENR